MRRRFARFGLVVLGLVATAWFFHGAGLATSWAGSYECSGCLATRRVQAWGLGSWHGGGPLWCESEVVSEHSPEARDLMAGGHHHQWLPLYFGSTFLGRDACLGCGGPPANPVARAYLENPRVREAVRSEIAAGRLSAAELRQICDLPGWPKAEDLATPARRALFARGQGLLLANGDPGSPRWAGWLEASRR